MKNTVKRQWPLKHQLNNANQQNLCQLIWPEYFFFRDQGKTALNLLYLKSTLSGYYTFLYVCALHIALNKRQFRFLQSKFHNPFI